MADMVSPDVLSLIAGVSERAIFRLVEAGAIHFLEAARVAACLSCYRRVSAMGPQFDPGSEIRQPSIDKNKE